MLLYFRVSKKENVFYKENVSLFPKSEKIGIKKKKLLTCFTCYQFKSDKIVANNLTAFFEKHFMTKRLL